MPVEVETGRAVPETLGAIQAGLEYQATYESGAAVLRSFLTRSPRPAGGVYALFALDSERRLRYVCSSDGAFDQAGFAAEIDAWPPGEPTSSGSVRLVPQTLHDWIAGLPGHGWAAWHSLSSPAGVDGLLLIWSGEGMPAGALQQFQQLAQLVGPFYSIWQNDRRQQQQFLRLKALEELSLAVASSLELQQVLQQAGDAVVGPLGFERADLYVLDEQSAIVQGAWRADARGERRDLSDQMVTLEDHDNPLVQVVCGEKEYHLEPASKSASNGHGPSYRAIVPLRGGGRVVGAIALDNADHRRSIDEEQIRTLLPFAAHAGAAVYNARIHQQLAQHLHEAEAMEQRRQQFERDVILAVTDGKLHLCNRDEIKSRLGRSLTTISLETVTDVAQCRQKVLQAALDAGLSPARRHDMELCIGEAGTNCYQHAGGGEARLCRRGDDLQLLISDHGPGIHSFVLPRATLLKGYSTAKSLGMGFSLILASCDGLFLATGVSGTDILIELSLTPRSEIDRVWEQLGLNDPAYA